MLSSPQEYYQRIISPLVERFLADPNAFDLAFCCCISIDHFCDFAAKHKGKSRREIIHEIENVNNFINIIHAVSVVAKHVTFTIPKNSVYIGLNVNDAEIGQGAAFSDGSYWSDGSSWAESEDVVRVKTPDGTLHDLSIVVASISKTIEDNFI